MTLLHPALLAGLTLVAVPVVLHLLMKARPKPLVFPALRLLQERTHTTARRLKLRHLWLLALRMAVLAGLVLALTRPRLPAGDYGLQAGDWIRVGLATLVAGLVWAVGEWQARRSPAPRHAVAWRRTLVRSSAVLAGLLGLAILFWPPYQRRVAASLSAPTPVADESLPVTAVFVFDTSLSMEYQQESQTRLDVARQLASQQIRKFPPGSRVAVCDTRDLDPIRFLIDPSLALKRIEQLSVSPVAQPLDARLLQALDAHADDRIEQSRLNPAEGTGPADTAPTPVADANAEAEPADSTTLREIYLLTDLTAAAWQIDGTERLKARLAEEAAVACHLIDVGIESPNNLAVTEIGLEAESVTSGSELAVRVSIAGVGSLLGKRTVELHILQPDGALQRQGAPQEVEVVEGTSAVARFLLTIDRPGGMQGEVRLVSSDPLSFDDTRRLTLLSHQPPAVWLVADAPADARFVQEALAPGPLVAVGQAQYRCEVASPSRLAEGVPTGTGLVCLLNVANPGERGWRHLTEFVERGGSLWVILGDRIAHAAYLTAEASRLLPAELAAPLSFRPPEYLDMPRVAHPALRRFEDWGSAAISAEPILRYWRVDPVSEAAVLLRYTDPREGAALIERSVGRGRVLMLTTPLDRRGWNDLPVAGWEYVALIDQLASWLTPQSRRRANFELPGEIRLEVEPQPIATSRLLRKPGGEQGLQDIPAGATQVVLKNPDSVGNYRLLPEDRDGAVATAEGGAGLEGESGLPFSVNPSAIESNLTRLGKVELDQRLGAERYAVARTLDQLERQVLAGRQGKEVFPWLLTLVVALFVGEHWFSNRFHEGAQPTARAREQAGAAARPGLAARESPPAPQARASVWDS